MVVAGEEGADAGRGAVRFDEIVTRLERSSYPCVAAGRRSHAEATLVPGGTAVGLFGRMFGKKPEEPDPSKPFMEHPSGDHACAKDAIVAALERLGRLKGESRWITFSGQGQGARPDAYHIEDVKVLGRTIDVGAASIDVDVVLQAAGLTRAQVGLTTDGGRISLPRASCRQMGEFLDALFRVGLGVRPFDDDEDYAVGAEW